MGLTAETLEMLSSNRLASRGFSPSLIPHPSGGRTVPSFLDAAFGLTTLGLAPLGHAPLVLEPGHLRISRRGRTGYAKQQSQAIDRELRPVRRDRREPAAIGSIVEREPAPSVFVGETNGVVRDGVPNYPPGTGLVIEIS